MIADNLQRRLHKLANANVKEMWNTIKPINMSMRWFPCKGICGLLGAVGGLDRVWMNEWMMFLLTRDKKLTSLKASLVLHTRQLKERTDELKHNAGWYEVREGSPVEIQWAVNKFFVNIPCDQNYDPEEVSRFYQVGYTYDSNHAHTLFAWIWANVTHSKQYCTWQR